MSALLLIAVIVLRISIRQIKSKVKSIEDENCHLKEDIEEKKKEGRLNDQLLDFLLGEMEIEHLEERNRICSQQINSYLQKDVLDSRDLFYQDVHLLLKKRVLQIISKRKTNPREIGKIVSSYEVDE